MAKASGSRAISGEGRRGFSEAGGESWDVELGRWTGKERREASWRNGGGRKGSC